MWNNRLSQQGNASEEHSDNTNEFSNPVAEQVLFLFEPCLEGFEEVADTIRRHTTEIRGTLRRDHGSFTGFDELRDRRLLDVSHLKALVSDKITAAVNALEERLKTFPRDLVTQATELLNDASTENRVTTTTPVVDGMPPTSNVELYSQQEQSSLSYESAIQDISLSPFNDNESNIEIGATDRKRANPSAILDGTREPKIFKPDCNSQLVDQVLPNFVSREDNIALANDECQRSDDRTSEGNSHLLSRDSNSEVQEPEVQHSCQAPNNKRKGPSSIPESLMSFLMSQDQVKEEVVQPTEEDSNRLTILSLERPGDTEILDGEVPGTSAAAISSTTQNDTFTNTGEGFSLFSSEEDGSSGEESEKQEADDDDVIIVHDDMDLSALIDSIADKQLKELEDANASVDPPNNVKQSASSEVPDKMPKLKEDEKLSPLQPIVLARKLEKTIGDELSEKGYIIFHSKATSEISDAYADSRSESEEEDSDRIKLKTLDAAIKRLSKDGEICKSKAAKPKSNKEPDKMRKKKKRRKANSGSSESGLESFESDQEEDKKASHSRTNLSSYIRNSVTGEIGKDRASVKNNSWISDVEFANEEEARHFILGSSDSDDDKSANSKPQKVQKSTSRGTDPKRLIPLPMGNIRSDSDSGKEVSPRPRPKRKQRQVIVGSSDSDSESEVTPVHPNPASMAVPPTVYQQNYFRDEISDLDVTDESAEESSDSSSVQDINPSIRIASSIYQESLSAPNRRYDAISDDDDDNSLEVLSKVSNSQGSASLTPMSSARSRQPRGGRRDIRAIIPDKDVDRLTKAALEEEKERKKRLKEHDEATAAAIAAQVRRVEPQLAILPILALDSNTIVSESERDEVQEEKRIVLHTNNSTGFPEVEVNYKIAKNFKIHQREGVIWMWRSVFETPTVALEKDGYGCILAHCMGLGKTLQVVGLVHCVLTDLHLRDKFKKVLVICPKTVVANWRNEILQWQVNLSGDLKVPVHVLSKSKPQERLQKLQDWENVGGIAVIHYNLYRTLCTCATLLTATKAKKPKPPTSNPRGQRIISEEELDVFKMQLLDPGPDILVLDEGHVLKNSSSLTYKAVKLIKTKRKIILTGTPLQNNLDEYYAMVNMIRPNLLGTNSEFNNRFKRPIENGQFFDSEQEDVEKMKRRAYKLNQLLKDIVHRKSVKVLTSDLPPKQEYTIFTKLTPKQMELYNHYILEIAKQGLGVPNGALPLTNRTSVLRDYQVVSKIIAHPCILKKPGYKDKKPKKKKKQPLDIEDVPDEWEDTDDEYGMSFSGASTQLGIPDKWFDPLLNTTTGQNMKSFELSGKLVILKEMLEACDDLEQKVLLFSQSLKALDVIESLLEHMDNENVVNEKVDLDRQLRKGRWQKGLDYKRLDGSTRVDDREVDVENFNEENSRTKLYLISTKAGGLGINLPASNRVIIFDSSWNPASDLQAIFRAYRYGQTKKCHVYRLVAKHTMEEQVYKGQVVKLAMAGRVIEKKQIERYVEKASVFYNAYPTDCNSEEMSEEVVSTLASQDDLLKQIFNKHKNLVHSVVEHDSLLQRDVDLTDEQMAQATTEFLKEIEDERRINNVAGNVAQNQSGNPPKQRGRPRKVTLPLVDRGALQHLNQKYRQPPYNYSDEQIKRLEQEIGQLVQLSRVAADNTSSKRKFDLLKSELQNKLGLNVNMLLATMGVRLPANPNMGRTSAEMPSPSASILPRPGIISPSRDVLQPFSASNYSQSSIPSLAQTVTNLSNSIRQKWARSVELAGLTTNLSLTNDESNNSGSNQNADE